MYEPNSTTAAAGKSLFLKESQLPANTVMRDLPSCVTSKCVYNGEYAESFKRQHSAPHVDSADRHDVLVVWIRPNLPLLHCTLYKERAAGAVRMGIGDGRR
jgi:hypothetical protein